jgi:hypothetical protein
MLQGDFDPLQMLEDLRVSQININHNQQKMAQLLQFLTNKVTEQQAIIDALIANITTQNLTNEQILKDLLTNINKSIQGQL